MTRQAHNAIFSLIPMAMQIHRRLDIMAQSPSGTTFGAGRNAGRQLAESTVFNQEIPGWNRAFKCWSEGI
jgi:hypothetical protein